jgi:hypothetical protein
VKEGENWGLLPVNAMARPLVYNTTIVERIDLTEALAIFRINLECPPRRPWFKSGQYGVIGVNNDEVPALGSVQRPMSIASAPESDGPRGPREVSALMGDFPCRRCGAVTAAVDPSTSCARRPGKQCA